MQFFRHHVTARGPVGQAPPYCALTWRERGEQARAFPVGAPDPGSGGVSHCPFTPGAAGSLPGPPLKVAAAIVLMAVAVASAPGLACLA